MTGNDISEFHDRSIQEYRCFIFCHKALLYDEYGEITLSLRFSRDTILPSPFPREIVDQRTIIIIIIIITITVVVVMIIIIIMIIIIVVIVTDIMINEFITIILSVLWSFLLHYYHYYYHHCCYQYYHQYIILTALSLSPLVSLLLPYAIKIIDIPEF